MADEGIEEVPEPQNLDDVAEYPATQNLDFLAEPLKLLPKETVMQRADINGGILAVSNYRVIIQVIDRLLIIPRPAVSELEYKDRGLVIHCKDGKSVGVTFMEDNVYDKWQKIFTSEKNIKSLKTTEDVLAFRMYAECKANNPELHEIFSTVTPRYNIQDEMTRMGFNKDHWILSPINTDFKFCKTYPEMLILPNYFNEDQFEEAASLRMSTRLPTAVWKHQKKPMVIARCSQPTTSTIFRGKEDEHLVCQIALCGQGLSPSSDRPKSDKPIMLIVDARSIVSATGNILKGGGTENTYCGYYSFAKLEFMNIPNIHYVRKSLKAVSLLFTDPENDEFYLRLDNTHWLSYIASIIKAAVRVVDAIEVESISVLIHCSDGWDRTPQISSLSQLMLDSYYRTFQGFQVLIEREWVSFGHRFAHRCDHEVGASYKDPNELSSTFLQWLDCVYQFMQQYPSAFEINEAYLLKIAQHVYSCMFGTFLYDNEKERKDANVAENTYSIWSFLHANREQFTNVLYNRNQLEVLRMSHKQCHLKVWTSVYHPRNQVDMGAPVTENENKTEMEDPVRENGNKAELDEPVGENGNKVEMKESVVEKVQDANTSTNSDGFELVKESECERNSKEINYVGENKEPLSRWKNWVLNKLSSYASETITCAGETMTYAHGAITYYLMSSATDKDKSLNNELPKDHDSELEKIPEETYTIKTDLNSDGSSTAQLDGQVASTSSNLIPVAALKRRDPDAFNALIYLRLNPEEVVDMDGLFKHRDLIQDITKRFRGQKQRQLSPQDALIADRVSNARAEPEAGNRTSTPLSCDDGRTPLITSDNTKSGCP